MRRLVLVASAFLCLVALRSLAKAEEAKECEHCQKIFDSSGHRIGFACLIGGDQFAYRTCVATTDDCWGEPCVKGLRLVQGEDGSLLFLAEGCQSHQVMALPFALVALAAA